MTQRIRYSTAYIHEFAAKIEQMVFEGYRIDHDSAFCARKRGSAYEIHFIPTRESLDYDGFPLTGSEEKELEEFYKEAAKRRLGKTSASEEHLRNLDLSDFDEFMKQCEPLPSELLDRMNALREKAESNRAMDELVEQAQELDMGYNKQLTIREKWEIDDEIDFQADEQKKLAESEDCGKMFYTKEQLDALYWTDLQEVGRKFGVKQRDRKKLTRMILEAQEKESEN